MNYTDQDFEQGRLNAGWACSDGFEVGKSEDKKIQNPIPIDLIPFESLAVLWKGLSSLGVASLVSGLAPLSAI